MLPESYRSVRQYTEQLCAPLKEEDYVPQVVEWASPPKWHLAHVTWFFEEMILKPNLAGYQGFSDEFAFLFNSYYQSMGDRLQRDNRGAITRPNVAEVYAYREHVDRYMNELLAEPLAPELNSLITLGINHEQQHQELFLTDLKYTFAQNPAYPVYEPEANLIDGGNGATGWAEIKEGLYEIGYQGEGFCFDNERSAHKVYLQEYQIAKGLVTNGEYLEFIQDGSYRCFQHWLDDGWTWLQQNQINHPLYWLERDGQWFQYTLAGLKPLDLDAPLAHISFYEANAFAAWKGARLPTEFEWEAGSDQFQWGQRWEWTNSAYLPYPGFAISAGAVGEYNGKFMVNQMVLRGASCATSEGHSRKTYRNFFHPHLQWQYSGIRLAK
jgi:ergothioneine biosynthesis protein EgtB